MRELEEQHLSGVERELDAKKQKLVAGAGLDAAEEKVSRIAAELVVRMCVCLCVCARARGREKENVQDKEGVGEKRVVDENAACLSTWVPDCIARGRDGAKTKLLY